MRICKDCPRNCGADRSVSVGYCRSPEKFRAARAALHFWEEPCLSRPNGSGAVFFSGCSLRCVYCQNYEISSENKGVELSEDDLIDIMKSLVEQCAQNINFVNPTHYASALAKLLERWKPPVPVVYNSSGYENVETLKRLDGLVDIYLPDLKYIRSEKAKRYSSAPDYFEKAADALCEMRRQVSDKFDGEKMVSGMIIRHLILPSNTNSSLEIIDWLCDNLPDTYVSLMAQYTPVNDLSNYPEINRKITKREYRKVLDYALDKGMEKLFIQERCSADEGFIPDFDFSGIKTDDK